MEPLRYYGRRPQAVLPLGERYYRLSASTVLPLGQDKADTGEKAAPMKRKENVGCDKDVYMLIPP